MAFSKSKRFNEMDDDALSSTSSVQSVSSLDRRIFLTPRPVRTAPAFTTPKESSIKIRELEREIRRLLAERSDLLKKLATKEEDARKLDYKLQAVIKEKQSVLSSLACFQRELKEVNRRNEILNIRVTHHEGSLRKKDPTMQLANLKATIAAKNHEIEDLRNEVSEVRTAYEQLVLQLGDKDTDIRASTDQLDSTIQTLQTELELAHQHANELQDGNEMLQRNKEDLFNQMEAMENNKVRSEDSTQQLNQHKEKLLKDLLECRRQLELKEEASARTIDTLRTENLALLLRVEGQTSQRRVQEKLLACELDNAYQKLATSEDCSKSLQEYRDSLVHRLSFLKDSVAELEGQQIVDMATIRDLKTEIRDMAAQLSSKERALLDADIKITSLSEQLHGLLENEEVVKDLQEECKRLGEELVINEAASKSQIEKIESELMIAELTLQSSRSEEAELREVVSQLRADVDAAKAAEAEVLELRSKVEKLTLDADTRHQELQSELDCVNEALDCQNRRCQEYEDSAKVKTEESQRLITVLDSKTAETLKLQAAVDAKSEEVAALSTSLSALTSEVNATKLTLLEKISSAESSEMALQSKSDELRELESVLVAKLEEIAELNEETELLNTELSMKVAHITRLEASVAAGSDELSRSKTVIEEQAGEIEKLKAVVNTQVTEVARLTADGRMLSILVEEREDTIAKLNETLDVAVAERNDRDGQVSELSSLTDKLRADLDAVRAELLEYCRQNEENLAARLVVDGELVELQNQLQVRQDEVAAMRGLIEEREKSIAASEEVVSELRVEVVKKDSLLIEKREELDRKMSALDEIRKDLDDKCSELHELRAVMSEANCELDVMRGEVESKNANLHQLGMELSDGKNKLDELETELTDKNYKLEELRDEVSKNISDLERVSEELFQKNAMFEQLRDEVSKNNVKLNETISERNMQLQECHEAISERNSIIEEFSMAISEKDMSLELLKEDIAAKNGELFKFNGVIAEKNTEIRELCDAISDKDAKIEHFTEMISLKDVQLKELQEMLALKVAECCAAISEKDVQVKDINYALSAKQMELEEYRNKMSTDIEVSRNEISKRDAELEKLRSQVSESNVKIEEFCLAMSEKNAELDELQVVLRRNEELTANLEANSSLVSDLADAREQLNSLLRCNDEQQTLVGELESDNLIATTKIRNLETQLKKHTANAEWYADRERELVAELSAAEERSQSLEQSLHTAEAELDGYRRTKEAEGRENEQLLQALTNEYETKMHSRSEELSATKSESNRWKALFEQLQAKVEPFMEQINAFEMERQVLVGRTREATSDLQKLSQDYAKLLGHQNHKQKIHYVAKMKEDYLAVKEENCKLRSDVLKYQTALRKYGVSTSAQRLDPSQAFLHDKENGTPLQPRKFTFN